MADALSADRAAIVMARGLGGRIAGYYKIVEQSSEQQIPSSRVLRIEQLEPLGLAIQMYCLYLRVLECNYDGEKELMDRAWRALATPQFRRDVVADAGKLYEAMRNCKVFRADATALSMVEERCAAIHPQLAKAPEFRAYVYSVAEAFGLLQGYTVT